MNSKINKLDEFKLNNESIDKVTGGENLTNGKSGGSIHGNYYCGSDAGNTQMQSVTRLYDCVPL